MKMQDSKLPMCEFVKKGSLFLRGEDGGMWLCLGRYASKWDVPLDSVYSPVRDTVIFTNILSGEFFMTYPTDVEEEWEWVDNDEFVSDIESYTLEKIGVMLQNHIDDQCADARGTVTVTMLGEIDMEAKIHGGQFAKS